MAAHTESATGPASPAASEARYADDRLVDLSQEIYQGMVVFPGHLKTVVWEHHSHDDTRPNFEGGFSYKSKGLLMSDHGPTHVDALSHLDPDPAAPSIERMALGRFYGPGTCIDISDCPPREYVTGRGMERALGESGAELRPGDILLLRTAAVERQGGTPDYARLYPGLDESAALWLLERDVKTFGVDSPSPDNPASRTYPVHMMCREHGITHYENLANLDRLVGRRFTFMGFPLRIREGTGSPVRAVALLEDGDAGR